MGLSLASGCSVDLHRFWLTPPKINRFNYNAVDEEVMYKYQTNHLASALLIQDYDPAITITSHPTNGVKTKFQWINRGEIVSGSFATISALQAVGLATRFEAKDLDIYFHSKDDVKDWCKLNGVGTYGIDQSQICYYVQHCNIDFNLIYGIPYTDAAQLISKFDIRACSVAYDPNTTLFHSVDGALYDAMSMKIVFNPVPRGVSVNRLTKYIQKGFTIDKYQRLFFAELVRTDIYSKELELTTGYKI